MNMEELEIANCLRKIRNDIKETCWLVETFDRMVNNNFPINVVKRYNEIIKL